MWKKCLNISFSPSFVFPLKFSVWWRVYQVLGIDHNVIIVLAPTPSDIISESELNTDVNSFFWWRIDFWTNYFGVSSQTTLSLFSQKSDFITGLDKPAMLAYSLLHVVSLWWLSCYIVLVSRSLKVIWLPVVTSCVGSHAVTRPFDGGEVSLHVPGKNSVF